MKHIVEELKNLAKLGIVGIKQSFEDEGALQQDVLTMRRITEQAGVDLSVKIGGCEAKTDIQFCKSIGVNKLVAPMIETPFALTKFIESVADIDDMKFYINIESHHAQNNLKEILESPSSKLLSGIVLGRSDMIKSYGQSKDQVDGYMMNDIVTNSFKTARREYGLHTIMGGNLSPRSSNIISTLYNDKLLNCIETRNVIIQLNDSNIKDISNLIKMSLLFESEWLKYKAESYNSLGRSYITRSEIIKDRL